MKYTNEKKHVILNKLKLTLTERTNQDKQYYSKILDRLYDDKRSEEIIDNLEGYLLNIAINKDNRVHKNHRMNEYINLYENDDFMELLDSAYVTMYMYASRVVNNPLVCNEDFLLSLSLASQRYLKMHKRENSKIEVIKKTVNKIIHEYESRETEVFKSKVLKK